MALDRESRRREYERNLPRYQDWAKRYREANREKLAEYHQGYHRRTKYGLTPERCAELLSAQEGKCAICGTELNDRFHVDHDHACCDAARSCGKCIRGLLCQQCNPGLGNFRDSTDTLRRAIEYLEKWERR